MWKPDRLLKLVLSLTLFTMIVVWLPLVRGLMDGETYEWGNTLFGLHFAGRGLGGDYWFLLLEAAFGLTLLYLGWRGARSPFHWMLLLWNVPPLFESVYNSLSFTEQYRFRGDTLGVDVSLAWVGPLFYGVLALLSIVWMVRDLRRGARREAPQWAARNSFLLAATLALLPVQFVLLRFGAPHGTTDQIGVLLTMAQWVLLNLSLYPWTPKEAGAHSAHIAATTV